ncbi:hypothetical protein ABIE44_001045 [Marmoricola sp. OAE513]|uniref:hypothetical protein n=1 Tax=Marmoricola sp. OAE513 TaxID=2817894 RepID=UPI001AE2BDFF
MISSSVAQRSLLATLEITVAASAAHAVAGGHLPGAGFLFAFAGIVFGCCLVSIGRVVRPGVVVPFVLVAQVGLHAALGAGPHQHGAPHGARVPAPGSEGFFGVLHLTPVMFWAHLVTALVTAILLLLQERVLAAVVARWHRALTPVVLPRLRRLALLDVVPALPGDALFRLAPRRGPPYAVVATH